MNKSKTFSYEYDEYEDGTKGAHTLIDDLLAEDVYKRQLKYRYRSSLVLLAKPSPKWRMVSSASCLSLKYR